MHVCALTRLCACVNAHASVCMCARSNICVCVHAHACVCTHVCVYVCMRMCVYARACAHLCVCHVAVAADAVAGVRRVCMCVHTHVCVYVCMLVCVNVCACVCTCSSRVAADAAAGVRCVCMCVCKLTHLRVYAHMCACHVAAAADAAAGVCCVPRPCSLPLIVAFRPYGLRRRRRGPWGEDMVTLWARCELTAEFLRPGHCDCRRSILSHVSSHTSCAPVLPGPGHTPVLRHEPGFSVRLRTRVRRSFLTRCRGRRGGRGSRVALRVPSRCARPCGLSGSRRWPGAPARPRG